MSTTLLAKAFLALDTRRMAGGVLIVGAPSQHTTLTALLEADGHHVDVAADATAGTRLLQDGSCDVLLVDLDLEDEGALAILSTARRRVPHPTTYVLATEGAIERAVSAIDEGADGYLSTPIHPGELRAVVRRGVERARLAREAARLREQISSPARFERLLGDHPAMQAIFRTVAQVARTRATILIRGETGTGKELIASAIHYRSPRKDGPYVRLNCAALAETLLESELFGHEKGAFTGAATRRLGRFEQANGGTLLLDEVSEMPLSTQVKLLRVLQERELERVGGNDTIPVDVRIVAATNKDLAKRVEEGLFREDLLYRLQIVEIEVPPLRARPSDIPALAQHFLQKFATENDLPVEGFEDDAMQALVAYPWPGNVRELENAIERAVVICDGPRVRLEHLPAAKHASKAPSVGMFVPGTTLAELERIAILKTLESVGGSTKRAAELLGISRRTIQYRLKEWGLGDVDG